MRHVLPCKNACGSQAGLTGVLIRLRGPSTYNLYKIESGDRTRPCMEKDARVWYLLGSPGRKYAARGRLLTTKSCFLLLLRGLGRCVDAGAMSEVMTILRLIVEGLKNI